MARPPRARGANARQIAAFETEYGTPPVAGWTLLPMAGAGSTLGKERGLLEDDQLGTGREPDDPVDDVVTNTGDLTVPVDMRAFGFWLKLMYGEPETDPADGATGSIAFSAQPANNSTVTVNGVAWTFKTAGAAGNQVNIGADLAATMTALATALNASADAGVAAATYTATATTIAIAHDALGPGGNAFTLAAGVGSNATPSGAHLAGGTNAHVFTTGAITLPSMSIEHGHPELPTYSIHTGALGNTLRIQMQRSGLLNATIGLICQDETAPTTTSADATPDTLVVRRFAQAIGEVTENGVQLATVRGATLSYSNNLDLDETIRPDGLINGADPGKGTLAVALTLNYTSAVAKDQVGTKFPKHLTFGWENDEGSLLFDVPRAFLPRVKTPISGPNGIQAEHNCQASGRSGFTLQVTLKNDMDGY